MPEVRPVLVSCRCGTFTVAQQHPKYSTPGVQTCDEWCKLAQSWPMCCWPELIKSVQVRTPNSSLNLSDTYGPESAHIWSPRARTLSHIQSDSAWHLNTELCTQVAWKALCALQSSLPSEHVSAYIDYMQAACSRGAAAPLTVVTNLFWNGAQQVTLLAKLAWAKLAACVTYILTCRAVF